MCYKYVLFLVLISNIVKIQSYQEVILTTSYGKLAGEKRDNYYAFENIPYAVPPIGEHRFEPVQLYEDSWTGIRNAKKPGSDCIQYYHETLSVRGEEDCLSLNIYTKNYANQGKLPVFFFIHGGAFTFGDGYLYGPTHIMDNMAAVYVNCNYRLGPMGFLSTEDNIVPGNMGLKDQTIALKWVQKNIYLFGGNPNDVTIIGFSAGGASVHLHYLTPLSAGLFRRGISHSGCSLDPWVMTEGAAEKSRQLAARVGCITHDNFAMIKCLKEKPANDIVNSVKLFQPFMFNPFTPFGVVVEKGSTNAFLYKAPFELLNNNNVFQLPWLLTFTKDEGYYAGAELIDHLDELDRRWNDLAPHILDFNRTIPQNKHIEISEKIKFHYIPDGKISRNSYLKIIQMITDRLYKTGFEVALRLHAKHNSANTFVEYYQFPASYGIAQIISKKDDPIFKNAVSHGDDVFTIYSNAFRQPDSHPYTADELKMIPKLIEVYSSFSSSGQPTFGGIKIEKTVIGTDNSFNYLQILNPDDIEMKRQVDISNMAFWKTIPFEGTDNILN